MAPINALSLFFFFFISFFGGLQKNIHKIFILCHNNFFLMGMSFNKKCPIGHFTSIWIERFLMVIAARLLAYKVAVDVAPFEDNKTLYDTTGKVVYMDAIN